MKKIAYYLLFCVVWIGFIMIAALLLRAIGVNPHYSSENFAVCQITFGLTWLTRPLISKVLKMERPASRYSWAVANILMGAALLCFYNFILNTL